MESTKERTRLAELQEKVQVGFKERLESRIDAILRQEQKSEADNSYGFGLRILNDIYDMLEGAKRQGEPIDMNAMLDSDERKDRFLKYVYRNAAHFAKLGDYSNALLAQDRAIYFSQFDNEDIRRDVESRASETIEQISRYVELEKLTSDFEANRSEQFDKEIEAMMLQKSLSQYIGGQLYLLGSPLYNLFMRGISALKGKLEKATSKYEQLKVIKGEEKQKNAVPDLSDPQRRIEFIRGSVCTDYSEETPLVSSLETDVQKEGICQGPEQVREVMEQIRAQAPQEPKDYYERTKKRFDAWYKRTSGKFSKDAKTLTLYSEPMTEDERTRAWNDTLMIHPHSNLNELLNIISRNPKDMMIREQVTEILKRKHMPVEDLFAQMDKINPSDSGAL